MMDEVRRLYEELSRLDAERKRIVQKIDALYNQERSNVERTIEIRKQLAAVEERNEQ